MYQSRGPRLIKDEQKELELNNFDQIKKICSFKEAPKNSVTICFFCKTRQSRVKKEWIKWHFQVRRNTSQKPLG